LLGVRHLVVTNVTQVTHVTNSVNDAGTTTDVSPGSQEIMETMQDMFVPFFKRNTPPVFLFDPKQLRDDELQIVQHVLQ
jgi:hypothetical protein